MKKSASLMVTLFLASVLFSLGTMAQKPITDVLSIDPDTYLDQSITIEGRVTQYFPEEAGKTSYYVLNDDYGKSINVNVNTSLSKTPSINREYRVTGIVKVNLDNGRPYLVENKRVAIIPIWIYVAGGVILLLFVVIVIVMLIARQKGKSPEKAGSSSKSADQDYDDSFKTVQVVKTADDPTLVHMKGKLKILNSEDAGKELILAGYPTAEGAVVTVGSAEVTGPKRYCHIRLKEKTVSRKQAEIIYYKREDKLIIKNLSKVNYTRINDEEIHVDEAREIKAGDRITMGELEFEYVS